MGEDSGEKTDEPTPHKLREARKKGQISKSKEFTSAVLLFVSFYTLKIYAQQMWGQLSSLTITIFSVVAEDFSGALAGEMLRQSFFVFFAVIGPLFAATYIAGILMELLQTNFLFAVQALEPKLDNLNPINGFKKLFALKQLVELFKSVIKMSVVIAIIYFVLKEEYYIVSQSQVRNPWVIMGFVGKLVIKIITRVGIAYFFLAIFDFFYQRYEFIKSMRMTKKEIKEEYKRLEGDPTVKQRQRQAQREMSQGRQMGAVPGADVVVTNPVHIAIAIKYDADTMTAPVVIAKGMRLNAEDIKAIAEEHYIPIVENPPLAQALYKQSKAGEAVPIEHYKMVAEILAFVYNLKKERQKR